MSILSQPGLWVGAGVVLAVVLLSGMLTRAPWWRIALAAAGALAFVAAAQWAWNLGIEAFIATGLAALGIAIWDESAVRLLEARRGMRVASEATAAMSPAVPKARARRAPAARTVTASVARPTSAQPGLVVRRGRAKLEPDAKPAVRAPSPARADPKSRTTRAAVGPGPATRAQAANRTARATVGPGPSARPAKRRETKVTAKP